MATCPTCFLSYSWESAEHQEWVRGLAVALQRNGVLGRIDQWDLRPGTDLQHYMDECVRTSDFVILICTPTYANKSNLKVGGTGYEKSLLTGELYGSSPTNHKFVPILRLGDPSNAIPTFMRSRVFIDFRRDEDFNGALELLLRHLFSTPQHMRPDLGSPPAFVSARSAEDQERIPSRSLRLFGGKYLFPLPSWWDEIVGRLPAEVISIKEVRAYITQRCGEDSGTKRTWRLAMKLWAHYYETSDSLPAYLGHCFKSGGLMAEAAATYGQLQELAELNGEEDSYLAYEAGRSYADLGQVEVAKLWFLKAAEFKDSTVSSVKYYAEQAIALMQSL